MYRHRIDQNEESFFPFFHSVKDIVGYEPEDLLGDSVNMVDFFHPADYKRMVPCEKFRK